MSRPLASLVLATHNHRRFVREAIAAALAQTYTPLEIVISDDASSDDTAALAWEMIGAYRGPHALRFHRNASNLGVGAHTDLLAEIATGQVLLLSAGDDVDHPDRVERVMAAFAAGDGRVMGVGAPVALIDERGAQMGESPATPLTDDLSLRAFALSGFPLRGAGSAYRRDVFERFGRIGAAVKSGEDLVLPLRAAMLGEIHLLATPASKYRQHGRSLAGNASIMAGSASDYATGLHRYLCGIAAARSVQLRDYRDFVQNSESGAADRAIAQALERRDRIDGAVARMATGEALAVTALLPPVVSRDISASDFVKAMAMAWFPRTWYRYLRVRAAMLERRQIAPRE